MKRVDLWYPDIDMDRTAEQPQAVLIHLIHVRAADGLLVEYDLDRDGYRLSMERPSRPDEDEPTGEWIEVGFIPAWAAGGPA